MEFTAKQSERYARHIALKEIGIAGQKKLLNSRVLIIGAGGLGSASAIYLASAGIGTLGIADSDRVDLSNLQRQIIHSSKDIEKLKVESAKESISEINPDVKVKTYPITVNRDNIIDLISGYDFIIDATDNFQSKFLINDACVISKKPFSHGGILGFQGQLMTYVPDKEGACYRCIFEDIPPENAVPTCREIGIMGAVCGVIGSLQAMETIKYLTGTGELLTSNLLTYNALKSEFRKIQLPTKNGSCKVCGKEPKTLSDIDYNPKKN